MYICYCPLRDPNWNKNIVLYCIIEVVTKAGLIVLVHTCIYTIKILKVLLPLCKIINDFLLIQRCTNINKTLISHHWIAWLISLFIRPDNVSYCSSQLYIIINVKRVT